MKSIGVSEVMVFHKKIIEQTGGTEGVLDIGLIEGAINRAFSTFGGTDLYESISSKIAAITHSLINNHGFVDGNKRVGVSVMLLLLQINNIKVQRTQSELVKLGLDIAKGNLDEKGIENWIERHTN